MNLIVYVITLFTAIQIVDYVLTKRKKNMIKKPTENDDFGTIKQFSETCIKLQDGYEKRNVAYIVILFIVATLFNILSINGGEQMKEEIVIDLKESLNGFYEEKIRPLETADNDLKSELLSLEERDMVLGQRILDIEDYLFPPGGDPDGPRIGRIEELQEEVRTVNNKLIFLEQELKKIMIQIAPRLEDSKNQEISEALINAENLHKQLLDSRNQIEHLNKKINRLKNGSESEGNKRFLAGRK